MNITIRKTTTSDVNAILNLIKELATYEKAPLEVSATEESMMKDGFSAHSIYESLVAETDGKIVGAAIFYVGYSTWKGKMVYLDDIIVTESMRRKGIGKLLFDEVARF